MLEQKKKKNILAIQIVAQTGNLTIRDDKQNTSYFNALAKKKKRKDNMPCWAVLTEIPCIT